MATPSSRRATPRLPLAPPSSAKTDYSQDHIKRVLIQESKGSPVQARLAEASEDTEALSGSRQQVHDTDQSTPRLRLAAIEKTRHAWHSHGQILALAFW